MQEILVRDDVRINPEQLAQVFRESGIVRPVDDLPRLATMLEHANLLLTAWDGERLVGVARALTDFVFCCYLSDLAVVHEYQKRGIGRQLIESVRARVPVGGQSMLLLLSAPGAMAYYPKVGFEKVENGWIMKRGA